MEKTKQAKKQLTGADVGKLEELTTKKRAVRKQLVEMRRRRKDLIAEATGALTAEIELLRVEELRVELAMAVINGMG